MRELLDYYKECFSLFDCIHFNSDLTRKEYEKILGKYIGKVVPITHNGIKDNRSIKTFSDKGLVVGFIGNDTPYKGLQVLKEAIIGLDIDLMVWGGRKGEEGRIHYRGRFSAEQLTSVYGEMDILVVPSIWKETFSFVTLEALSYGVPVLVSDNVGAQDIVKKYDSSFVYHTKTELKCLLAELEENKGKLVSFNKSIVDNPWMHDVYKHAEKVICEIYR